MIYVYTITTPTNTLASAKLKTILPIAAGRISEVSLQFPSGAVGYHHIQINRGLHQLWPLNPDGDFATSDETIHWFEQYDLAYAPWQVEAYTWNLDTVYDHTVTVRIVTVPLEAKTDLTTEIANLMVAQQAAEVAAVTEAAAPAAAPARAVAPTPVGAPTAAVVITPPPGDVLSLTPPIVPAGANLYSYIDRASPLLTQAEVVAIFSKSFSDAIIVSATSTLSSQGKSQVWWIIYTYPERRIAAAAPAAVVAPAPAPAPTPTPAAAPYVAPAAAVYAPRPAAVYVPPTPTPAPAPAPAPYVPPAPAPAPAPTPAPAPVPPPAPVPAPAPAPEPTIKFGRSLE